MHAAQVRSDTQAARNFQLDILDTEKKISKSLKEDKTRYV